MWFRLQSVYNHDESKSGWTAPNVAPQYILGDMYLVETVLYINFSSLIFNLTEQRTHLECCQTFVIEKCTPAVYSISVPMQLEINLIASCNMLSRYHNTMFV